MRVLTLLLSLIGLSLAGTAAQAEWRGFATADVNLRTGPGTGYSVVDVVPEGVRVFVDSCRGAWCAVDYRGEQGFVSRRYLEQTRVRDYAPRDEIYIDPDYDDTPAYGERRARRDHRRQLRHERRLRENRRVRRQRRSQDDIIVEREPRRRRTLRGERRRRADRRPDRRNRVETGAPPPPPAAGNRTNTENRNRNADETPRRQRAGNRNRDERQAQPERRPNDRRARGSTPRNGESAGVLFCPEGMTCDENGRVFGTGK